MVVTESDTLIFGSSGGGSILNIEPLEGASSYGALIEGKATVTLEEPVYLAYWIGSVDDRISAGFTKEDYADLKSFDRAFLLKAEINYASA